MGHTRGDSDKYTYIRLVFMCIEQGESGSIGIFRRQDGKLFRLQLLLERRAVGVKLGQALTDSHQLVLLVQGQGPFHVELAGHQKLDRRAVGQLFVAPGGPVWG